MRLPSPPLCSAPSTSLSARLHRAAGLSPTLGAAGGRECGTEEGCRSSGGREWRQSVMVLT
eukprot:802664-Rhodomonas_salina.1